MMGITFARMKCLILAGGFGTRLKPFTNEVAKPLIPLVGKPVISYIVEKVPEQIEIIVSVNAKFKADFMEWRKGLKRNIEIFVEQSLSDEEKLGALKSIDYLIKKKKVEEDLLVIAGDNFFLFSLSDFIGSYNGRDPLVAVYDIKDKDKARDFGIVRLKGRKIVGFDEKPAYPSTSLVATACYILPRRVFRHLSDCCAINKNNLGDFIAHLVERRDVYAYTFKEDWFDIGTIESYEEAKGRLLNRLGSSLSGWGEKSR
jgi:glucose-1-phosphate thymidylyltransferase